MIIKSPENYQLLFVITHSVLSQVSLLKQNDILFRLFISFGSSNTNYTELPIICQLKMLLTTRQITGAIVSPTMVEVFETVTVTKIINVIVNVM